VSDPGSLLRPIASGRLRPRPGRMTASTSNRYPPTTPDRRLG